MQCQYLDQHSHSERERERERDDAGARHSALVRRRTCVTAPQSPRFHRVPRCSRHPRVLLTLTQQQQQQRLGDNSVLKSASAAAADGESGDATTAAYAGLVCDVSTLMYYMNSIVCVCPSCK